MWMYYNPNPAGSRVGDCSVRAVARALDMTWHNAYMELCAEGLSLSDMPSANRVWGSLLHRNGFKKHMVDAPCEDCCTIEQFCMDHPRGLYVVALPGHVVCVQDGKYYDSWDCGQESPVYYWQMEG